VGQASADASEQVGAAVSSAHTFLGAVAGLGSAAVELSEADRHDAASRDALQQNIELLRPDAAVAADVCIVDRDRVLVAVVVGELPDVSPHELDRRAGWLDESESDRVGLVLVDNVWRMGTQVDVDLDAERRDVIAQHSGCSFTDPGGERQEQRTVGRS
jgi:hypothetical protein